MHVEFKTDGGVAYFPELVKPVHIDCEQWPEGDAAEFVELIEEAHFFELPTEVGKPRPGAADCRTHTITIDTGGRRHGVRVVEPVNDASLLQLVRFVEAKAKTQRMNQGSTNR